MSGDEGEHGEPWLLVAWEAEDSRSLLHTEVRCQSRCLAWEIPDQTPNHTASSSRIAPMCGSR